MLKVQSDTKTYLKSARLNACAYLMMESVINSATRLDAFGMEFCGVRVTKFRIKRKCTKLKLKDDCDGVVPPGGITDHRAGFYQSLDFVNILYEIKLVKNHPRYCKYLIFCTLKVF